MGIAYSAYLEMHPLANINSTISKFYIFVIYYSLVDITYSW